MENDRRTQVDRSHYFRDAYDHKARWLSYWYQISLVREVAPRTLLEVGPGSGIVTAYLRERGIVVRTLDIDATLHPDIVASVSAIPLPDASVDAAMAAEVLEHLPFPDVPHALRELRRVSRRHVILSVPDSRRTVLSAGLHVPRLGWKALFLKMQSRREHVFDGQHHWEIGKRGYPLSKALKLFPEAGLRVVRHFVPADCPTKHFFLAERTA